MVEFKQISIKCHIIECCSFETENLRLRLVYSDLLTIIKLLHGFKSFRIKLFQIFIANLHTYYILRQCFKVKSSKNELLKLIYFKFFNK